MAELLPQYFAFEGCDGVGKSALCSKLLEEVRARHESVLFLKEPARYVVYPKTASKNELIQAFTADRFILLEETVRPWLSLRTEAPILSDRSFVSTMVGQTFNERGFRIVWDISRRLPYLPQTIFHCDAPTEVIVERLSGREDQEVMSLSGSKSESVDTVRVMRTQKRYAEALSWLQRRHDGFQVIPLDMRASLGDLTRTVLDIVLAASSPSASGAQEYSG